MPPPIARYWRNPGPAATPIEISASGGDPVCGPHLDALPVDVEWGFGSGQADRGLAAGLEVDCAEGDLKRRVSERIADKQVAVRKPTWSIAPAGK